MKTPVYLDHNSTTPVDTRVLQAMLPFFSEKFGNAASKTHAFGWQADEAVKQAREQVAQLIGCESGEIIFTSGATEAINLGLKGAYDIYKSKGNHIITVSTEHKAVLDTCRSLEKKGAKVTYLPVDREGMIDTGELQKAFTPETILVCAMFANNETGVIHPVSAISKLAHGHGAIFMCDATQAVGKIPVDVQSEGIDLLCLSAHKFYGPKGAGALFVRRKDPRVILAPLIDGGGHEKGLRSGTLNVPAIVGLGATCKIAMEEMWEDGARISKLRIQLEQALTETAKVFVNGSQRDRLYNTTNLLFRNLKADSLIARLPGIAVSTGSACTAALPEPSHVLKAMGLSDEEAYSSVRFSLGKYTTQEEISYVVSSILEVAGSPMNLF